MVIQKLITQQRIVKFIELIKVIGMVILICIATTDCLHYHSVLKGIHKILEGNMICASIRLVAELVSEVQLTAEVKLLSNFVHCVVKEH